MYNLFVAVKKSAKLRVIFWVTIGILLFIPFFALNTNKIIWTIHAETSEEQRILNLKKELELVLPNAITDPNYKITFKNPSDKKITITIDGKTYNDVKSPFKLPNLTIGEHTIIFKYTNKSGVLRVLTLKLIVIPREPSFKKTQQTTFTKPEPVKLSGIATPNGQLLIVINGNKSETVQITSAGTWEYILPEIEPGTYHIMIFSIKNNLINSKGSSITITYKDKTQTNTIHDTENNKPKTFIEQVKDFIRPNRDYFVYAIAGITGILLAYIIVLLVKYFHARNEEKTLAELLHMDDDSDIVDILEDNNDVNQISEKSNAKTSKTRSKKQTKTLKRTSTTSRKKPVTQLKEKSSRSATKSKKGKPVIKNENVPEEVTLKISSKRNKTIKRKTAQKTTKSSDKKETAEPIVTKKVLSKEEFLKKFKQKDKKH